MLEQLRLTQEIGIPFHSIRDLRQISILKRRQLFTYLSLVHLLPFNL
jgi:hypothetical protein